MCSVCCIFWVHRDSWPGPLQRCSGVATRFASWGEIIKRWGKHHLQCNTLRKPEKTWENIAEQFRFLCFSRKRLQGFSSLDAHSPRSLRLTWMGYDSDGAWVKRPARCWDSVGSLFLGSRRRKRRPRTNGAAMRPGQLSSSVWRTDRCHKPVTRWSSCPGHSGLPVCLEPTTKEWPSCSFHFFGRCPHQKQNGLFSDWQLCSCWRAWKLLWVRCRNVWRHIPFLDQTCQIQKRCLRFWIPLLALACTELGSSLTFQLWKTAALLGSQVLLKHLGAEAPRPIPMPLDDPWLSGDPGRFREWWLHSEQWCGHAISSAMHQLRLGDTT